eukprot:1569057-Lingulodinium_polyedra.AAC.1
MPFAATRRAQHEHGHMLCARKVQCDAKSQSHALASQRDHPESIGITACTPTRACHCTGANRTDAQKSQ